jgi:hypothetical protein
MTRMQLTWDFEEDGDGEGEAGGVVDCVAGCEVCAPDGAVDGGVDCPAAGEVAERPGVVDELGDGEVPDEPGDGELAEALALALAVAVPVEPLLIAVNAGANVEFGPAELELVPGLRGTEVDTVATAPTAVSPP